MTPHHTFDPDGDVFLLVRNSAVDKSSEAIDMQVSSKHLTLASPVFKAMLSRNYLEGATLNTMGSVQVNLDDDSQALVVLLSIIHSQPSKIPSSIDLNLLVGIATLVDKYQLHEAAALLSGYWINALKREIPKEWCEAMYHWLFISWVFKLEDEFKLATHAAQRCLQYPIEKSFEATRQDLPMPESAIRRINEGRERAIGPIVNEVHQIITDYQSMVTNCISADDDCDAFILGQMIKKLRIFGLINAPLAPYDRTSLNILSFQFHDFRLKSLCGVRKNRPVTHGEYCASAVLKRIENVIKKAEGELRGLSLVLEAAM